MTTRRPDIVASPGFSDDDSAPASNLSSMQRAIVTIQKLRAKVESLERARIEPIAIVGMACRFPGGADTPEAFFQLLDAGVDAVTEVPPSRWGLEPDGVDLDNEQRSVRWGAFLKDVDRFDAAFFGISPREAESLDPQQRLLLEVTWEALERAGQLPEKLMGTKAGVFIGIWTGDYQHRMLARDSSDLDAYCLTGTLLATAAGRLSYTLGVQGPCMSVDTVCSSSLTAIHLGCQSLRSGESSMVLAGGVNLLLSQATSKLLSKTQTLSPDGRCKTFDARANGFVRGEGCGILVLKRLSDAEKDGDTILALIRGSAVNQDGRSTGLTAPNVLSQQALLRQALENARLTPHDIGYVEAHGTGTSLGDPIEMEAIKAVLGAPREKGASCIVGAVKTNIGHLEAAAGVAGIMKVVLSLQNDKIPGNLHFRSLNPRIDLKGTALEIAQDARPWAPGLRPRFGGVSSFGMSGTNAHVILEEAPRNLEEAIFDEEATTYMLPLSAKTPEALRDLARSYHALLSAAQSPRLLDIVYTASARRSHYLHRLAVVGKTKEELAAQLLVHVAGNTLAGFSQGQATPARAKVVFVFSGQGSQWLGMGKLLYESDASFRSVIDTCDNLMTVRLGWSILDELDATEATSRMGETQVAQPLLFAVQIALVEMLRSWGIAPDAMIGHSVGEIAAAHIAGILSLDEAIRLVAIRGRIMQKATGMGKMAAVAMTPEQARDIVSGYEDRVSIAAINDPCSVVLSGASSAIDDVIVRCEKQGFEVRSLRSPYPFHSPQMEPFERELVDRLVRVDTRRATLAMYSTMLADCVDGKELDVKYWGRNVRQTVDFAGAVFAAIRDGYQLFLEVGPNSDLVSNVHRCFLEKKTDGFAVGSLQYGKNDRRALLESAGALYTRGCSIEWSRITPNGGRCVSLPTYPWQRERFWVDAPKPTDSPKDGATRPKVVFVFPGQGSQWLGMGRQLLAEEEVFRTALSACDTAIRQEADFSVLNELQSDESTSRLDEIDIVQPLLFAMEVALAALWRSKGIQPDCVVGHSMGEVAAAHVAGMLSLNDAVKVICRRSRLLKRIRGQGAMALVELPVAEAEGAIAAHTDKLSIAVSNGPRSTVIAGEPQALDEVLAMLKQRDIYVRHVKVDVASHSPQVDALRSDLLAGLEGLRPTPGTIPMLSTVSGEPLRGVELVAEYWWNNLRKPVRFSQATRSLVENNARIFVELSPHPILLTSIEEYLNGTHNKGMTVASMRRNASELGTLELALASVRARIRANATGSNVNDSYALSHATSTQPNWSDLEYPLLGKPLNIAALPDKYVYEKLFNMEDLAWLGDHRVRGAAVFPGMGYVEIALELGQSRQASVEVREIYFEQMLVCMEKETRYVQCSLNTDDNGVYRFDIAARTSATSQWTRHASGSLVSTEHVDLAPQLNLEEIRARCTRAHDTHGVYLDFERRGIHYGPAFRALRELWSGIDELFGYVELSDVETLGYRVHPALLDACLHGLSPRLPKSGTYVPMAIDRFICYEEVGSNAWVHLRPKEDSTDKTRILFDISLVNENGRVLVRMEGLQLALLAEDVFSHDRRLNELVYCLRWRPQVLDKQQPPTSTGTWLLIGDNSEFNDRMAALLLLRGNPCVQFMPGKRKDVDAPSSARLFDVDDARSLQVQLRELFSKNSVCQGVIYAAGDSSKDVTVDDAENSLNAMTRIIQTLASHPWRDAPRFFLVTRSAQTVQTDDILISPAPASLWGAARTITLEHPEFACTRIDVAQNVRVEELVDELAYAQGEDQIALRGNARFVARLTRSAFHEVPERVFSYRHDATYLITGGLGGIGLAIAQSMVAKGAQHVVLVGRNAPNETAAATIDAMNSNGAKVRYACADISIREEVVALLERIGRDQPILRGIVHAAGVLDDSTLVNLQPVQVHRVFGPKVRGTIYLDELTRGIALDFFVFCSSAAVLLGSPGQAHYAAANAFMDAVAQRRSASGLAATSIQWGSVADVGLAAALEIRGQRLSQRGIGTIPINDVTTAFGWFLERPRPEVGFIQFSPRQWREFNPRIAHLPYLSELNDEHASDASTAKKDTFKLVLEALPANKRQDALLRHITEVLARVLRMDVERMDVVTPLKNYGVDSLMSLEVRNLLENSLGLRLSATLLFTYPTIEKTAKYLHDLIFPRVEKAVALDTDSAPEFNPQADRIREISEMSDDDAAAVLEAKLLDLEDYLP